MPAAITVTNAGDSGPGSLRAAITRANLDAAPDTIRFAPSARGTITLQSALPDLSTGMTIAGPGQTALTVARSTAAGTPDFRIFTVPAGVEVNISGLTMTGGYADQGGGIYAEGTLTVTGSTLSGNSAVLGGGIASVRATVTITNSTLSGNKVQAGGGIWSDAGTLTVTDSTLSGNSAINAGGIYNYDHCAVTIINSTLSGNSATSVASGTGNIGGVAGGILNASTLTVISSTLSDNSATSDGGGIYTEGTLTVTDSTFGGNSAAVGGGIYAEGTLTVTDSTFGGNSAAVGGGIASIRATVTVATSIFVNTSGGNLGIDTTAGGSFTSLGHNLFSDTPAVPLDRTDLIDTDPLLGPLADNGGPTRTMALLPGSPAIDAGAPAVGVTTDQRGIARPQESAPDIGAFESRGFSLSVVAGSGQRAPTGSTFRVPLTVSVTSAYGEPVEGGRVTFAAPSSGPSARFADNPATIRAGGRTGVDASANNLGGTYAVIAQAAGAGVATLIETNVGPKVVGLKRTGIHLQPTHLVLRFNRPMDAASVQDLRNYSLNPAGANGFAGHHPAPIPIVAAVYDPTTRAVTLAPRTRLALRGYYVLTVAGAGPHPVRDVNGAPLTGTGTRGRPGDYIAVVHGHRGRRHAPSGGG